MRAYARDLCVGCMGCGVTCSVDVEACAVHECWERN